MKTTISGAIEIKISESGIRITDKENKKVIGQVATVENYLQFAILEKLGDISAGLIDIDESVMKLGSHETKIM